MSDMLAGLLSRIHARSATVGIIGLGYVGLPLARAFARTGFHVIGFDIDPVKVAKLNAGKSYIKQIPDSTIVGMREKGFEATDRFDRLNEPDAILICVPTPLTESREPDLSYVVDSAHAVAAQLRPGQLVVLESTTYPTTTRKVLLPILERTGLIPGKEFLLAFSPEREDPGNATFSVNNIPKVVGGLDAPSGEAACALYSAVVPQVVKVSAPEIAEACKILASLPLNPATPPATSAPPSRPSPNSSAAASCATSAGMASAASSTIDRTSCTTARTAKDRYCSRACSSRSSR